MLTKKHAKKHPYCEPVRGQRVEIPSPEADELVERAIAGDVDAFASLFEITLPSVYRYLYGRSGDATLAEDLAQDAYMRAMRAIQTSFKGASTEFVAWMIRIARNRFLDHVKSGRVRWEVVVDETPVTLATSNPETRGARSRRRRGPAQGARRGSRAEQQEIVFLRFFQGLQIAEVAAVTGRTEGAVKALQFRALRALERVIVDRSDHRRRGSAGVTRDEGRRTQHSQKRNGASRSLQVQWTADGPATVGDSTITLAHHAEVDR